MRPEERQILTLAKSPLYINNFVRLADIRLFHVCQENTKPANIFEKN
jgi:hypothetical protein